MHKKHGELTFDTEMLLLDVLILSLVNDRLYGSLVNALRDELGSEDGERWLCLGMLWRLQHHIAEPLDEDVFKLGLGDMALQIIQPHLKGRARVQRGGGVCEPIVILHPNLESGEVLVKAMAHQFGECKGGLEHGGAVQLLQQPVPDAGCRKSSRLVGLLQRSFKGVCVHQQCAEDDGVCWR